MQKNVSVQAGSIQTDQQGYISTRTPSETNWIGILTDLGATPLYPASFVIGNWQKRINEAIFFHTAVLY
jgi:hypothetical protein